MENLKLFTEGKVKTENGREFTRLVGGFKEDNPVVTDKQIAELLEYKMGARQVRQQIDRNIQHFQYGQDLLDFKREDMSNTLEETLISLGYAKQSITQSKNIYILSQAGFLLYLKFAEGDKSVEIYKNFIEDYFKTKIENKVMKKTLDEEKEFLTKRKKFILGSMFMEEDEQNRMKLFRENEKISDRIKEIDVVTSKEKLIEELQPKIKIADSVSNVNNFYDLGTIAKILNIPNMGRNNLFKWLKDKEILMNNNTPYQRFIKYFKVITVTNKYTNMANSKTLLRPKGVEYIVKKLIDDGKIITKPVDEILEELEQTA